MHWNDSVSNALEKLRAAGHIKSVWLPGMLLGDRAGDGSFTVTARCYDVDDDGVPWFVDCDSQIHPLPDERPVPDDGPKTNAERFWFAVESAEIIPEDPATKGCLRALLAEAGWIEVVRTETVRQALTDYARIAANGGAR